MSKKPKIVSAGGVVLRQHTSGLQVLLIHRDRYDDWSLPKGKRETDELLPETAVREIREETGVASRLDLRLPSVRYKVSKGPKAVHYWRSEVVSQRPPPSRRRGIGGQVATRRSRPREAHLPR